MAFMVMCCGCGRLLGPDGKLVGEKTGGGGFLVKDGKMGADFPTKEAADKAASKSGWSVADEDGPNHRCPECVERLRTKQEVDEEYSQSRRGAYIEVQR